MITAAEHQQPNRLASWVSDNATTIVECGTIAAGVLASYLGFRGRRDPEKIRHDSQQLLSATDWMQLLQQRVTQVEQQLNIERAAREADRTARDAERLVYQQEITQLRSENTLLQTAVADLRARLESSPEWQAKYDELSKKVHADRQLFGRYQRLVFALQDLVNHLCVAIGKPERFPNSVVIDWSLIGGESPESPAQDKSQNP